MNIQMQVAGLFIMLILLYFSLRQQMVGLYSETMFLRVLSVTILCVCLDIASVVAIVYEDRIPRLVLVKVMWYRLCGSAFSGWSIPVWISTRKTGIKRFCMDMRRSCLGHRC